MILRWRRRRVAMTRIAFLLLANSAGVNWFPHKLSFLDQPALGPKLCEGFLDSIMDNVGEHPSLSAV